MSIYLKSYCEISEQTIHDPNFDHFKLANGKYCGMIGTCSRTHLYLTLLTTLPRHANWRDGLQEMGQQFAFSKLNTFERNLVPLQKQMQKPAGFLSVMTTAFKAYPSVQTCIFPLSTLQEVTQLVQDEPGMEGLTKQQLIGEAFGCQGRPVNAGRTKLNEALCDKIKIIRSEAINNRWEKFVKHFKQFHLLTCIKDIYKIVQSYLNAHAVIKNCQYFVPGKLYIKFGSEGAGADCCRTRLEQHELLWKE